MTNMRPQTKDALVFDNISHRYGQYPAIDHLSLSIAEGEMVCLLGPSGCGKTTALRIAAGLETPEKGRLILHGQCVSGEGVFIAPEKRDIGLVFQDYALFPHLSVEGNIAFGMTEKPKSEQNRVITESLGDVGMLDYRSSYPHTLSGGQQQRVALARALARQPKLILMDEPFSGLDARLRDSIRDHTLHLVKQTGIATLMVTHDAEEAMYMADRIVVMNEGKIVQVGTPEALYYKPVNAFVAAFFGDVNSFYAVAKDGVVHTALGDIPAPHIDDGEEANIVIRPEALKLENAAETAKTPGYGSVKASRLLGRSSLIHLDTCDRFGQNLHLHSRIPGRYLPKEGSVQKIALDMQQVFVFA